VDRRGWLYFLVIVGLLVLWVITLLWNNSIGSRSAVPSGPTPNLDGTVTMRLTRSAPNPAQLTQVFVAEVSGAVEATQYAQASTATAQSQMQTATAIPPITATAQVIIAGQTATASAEIARQATNQAATATLMANGTTVADLGAANRATQVARSAQDALLEAAIGNAGILDVTTAAKLEQAITLKQSGSVERVVFNADGSQLASASGGEVILWSTRTSQPLATLRHENQVNDMAFSPDGKILATLTDEGTLWLWDATTGAGRDTLKAHKDTAFKLAFSPDGTMLATAGKDGTFVWEVATGKLLASLPSGWAWTVTFSPGGRYVVTSGGDGSVRVWAVPVVK